MYTEQTIIYYETDKPITQSGASLRGFISKHYPAIPIFHHHLAGKYFYNHPLIQYKIIDSKAFIVGIEKGSAILRLINSFDRLILENEVYKVLNIHIKTLPITITASRKPKKYFFLTPWIALNQKNYEIYSKIKILETRKNLLIKILIGNVIAMSKGVGYAIIEPIRVDICDLKEKRISLKNIPMLGFLCEFSINFNIPNYWGLGKSVSRGFGTIKQLKE